MKHLHFLGNINHDNWAGHVGTMLLLSFGPESRALIAAHYQTLTGLAGLKSLELDSSELVDFSVRQVRVDGLATDAVEDFSELAKEADNPLPVPAELLKDVLLLTDEFDDTLINHLPLFRQGTLEISVGLSDMFQGRSFHIDGAVSVAQLTGHPEKETSAA